MTPSLPFRNTGLRHAALIALGTVFLFSTRLQGSLETSGDAPAPPRIGVALRRADGEIKELSRANERFALCSTFKFLAVAAALQRVDQGEEKLDRRIPYTEKDLQDWAPITKQHVGEGGMTLEALCAAAISYSDNTAGNLVLQAVGGPPGLTKWLGSMGDQVTRSDRFEPEMNRVGPGDARDTTSPAAMLRDMEKILLGEQLKEDSRKKLEQWMAQNTTGDGLIRSVLPPGWKIGDKTGRNAQGELNDLAILRGPNSEAILLAIYTEAPGLSAEAQRRLVAEQARQALEAAAVGKK